MHKRNLQMGSCPLLSGALHFNHNGQEPADALILVGQRSKQLPAETKTAQLSPFHCKKNAQLPHDALLSWSDLYERTCKGYCGRAGRGTSRGSKVN